MSEPIRVVQYGLGPIGLEVAQTVLNKEATGPIRLVGAIDIDPAKIGRDVAELLSLEKETGITISDDADHVLAETRPDVVLHTTSSFLDAMHRQLVQCLRAGAHVVSSAEELAFPYERHPELSEALDQTAREHGVVLIGAGVNPGYVMDTLALTATGACSDVQAVHVERVVDAGKRRLPLQQKVGAGLTEEAFYEKKQTGTFGHIGLRESLLFLADGLGWTLDVTNETLKPVLAEETVKTPFLTVERGAVAGIHHAIGGYMNDRPVLTLDLKMYVGAPEPRDAVRVEGDPPIDLVVREGVFGDTATVAVLVNTVPLVLKAAPGLRTMKDLPIPRAFATSLARQQAPTP